MAGYSGYRIFEETIRIDSSAHFLGLRLNFFVAIVGTVAGLTWFVFSQRRRPVPEPAGQAPPAPSGAGGSQPQESDDSQPQKSGDSQPQESGVTNPSS